MKMLIHNLMNETMVKYRKTQIINMSTILLLANNIMIEITCDLNIDPLLMTHSFQVFEKNKQKYNMIFTKFKGNKMKWDLILYIIKTSCHTSYILNLGIFLLH
jgi:hypothetical protein